MVCSKESDAVILQEEGGMRKDRGAILPTVRPSGHRSSWSDPIGCSCSTMPRTAHLKKACMLNAAWSHFPLTSYTPYILMMLIVADVLNNQ